MSSPPGERESPSAGLAAALVEEEALFNIASVLDRSARLFPFRPALIVSEGKRQGRRLYSQLTFAQLAERTDRAAHALARAGIERGMRTLLLVRPGHDFVSLAFALFKIGAVPVLIDPGMGTRRLIESIAGVEPAGLVGIPRAHLARRLFPRAFRSVRVAVTVGGRGWPWGAQRLESLLPDGPRPFPPAPTRPDDPAAVLFTSGATGPAKGALYAHAQFRAQVEAIRDAWSIEPGEVDLPAFPLFVLFSVAFGATSVVPDMDPSRPGRADPARLVEAIIAHGVTYSFGSPALWKRVGEYCQRRGIRLPSLRRVLIAGAPVSERVLAPFRDILDRGADTHTPYGATEALPVASIAGSEVLGETAAETRRGQGTCVGRPLPGVELAIIAVSDEPLAAWDESRVLQPGQVGEIAVQGPVVTRSYERRPLETALAKVPDGEAVWHRMGDLGWLDERGRLWVVGRKAHRVQTPAGTLYPLPCEAIFNQHPAVARSALVGVGPAGAARPAIVVELDPGRRPGPELTAELLALGQAAPHTRAIRDVLYHPAFPVDCRHNAKIDRAELARWAAARLT